MVEPREMRVAEREQGVGRGDREEEEERVARKRTVRYMGRLLVSLMGIS